jgi:predicted Fe-Mo cluster-binding NifX family protein
VHRLLIDTERAAQRDVREEYEMKIAITATGPDLSSEIDPRFGRARYLLLVDSPERTFVAVDNRAGMDAAQGAGIQAAQTVIDNKARVLISGHCGPKAFRALKAAGVQVYLASGGTVAEALGQYESGGLVLAPSADVDGHW